tara:strand:+ start:1717 stop:2091 length:375 start_codon:yes stop_codon:yes gene_type:complete
MDGVQDADDLSQQVYVRAFSKLDQFGGDSKFETWLYRLATNEALQHLRREKHRRRTRSKSQLSAPSTRRSVAQNAEFKLQTYYERSSSEIYGATKLASSKAKSGSTFRKVYCHIMTGSQADSKM